METIELQRLLNQAESLYRSERLISGYLQELQADTSNTIAALQAEEHRNHCCRLEGLIEILNRNIARGLSPVEADQCAQYCSELLHRFVIKHASTYQMAMSLPMTARGSEVADSLVEAIHYDLAAQEL